MPLVDSKNRDTGFCRMNDVELTQLSSHQSVGTVCVAPHCFWWASWYSLAFLTNFGMLRAGVQGETKQKRSAEDSPQKRH